MTPPTTTASPSTTSSTTTTTTSSTISSASPALDETQRDLRLRATRRYNERLADELATLQAQVLTEREQQMEPWVMQAAALGGALPKFNGDPAGKETFNTFLQDYKLSCDSFGITDENAALALGRCLEGHARQVYKDAVAAKADLKKNYNNLTAADGIDMRSITTSWCQVKYTNDMMHMASNPRELMSVTVVVTSLVNAK